MEAGRPRGDETARALLGRPREVAADDDPQGDVRHLEGEAPAGRLRGVEPTYVTVWDTKEKGSDVSLASFMLVDGF